MTAGSDQGFKLFIEGLSCPPEEFALALIGQGLDAARVDHLIRAIPCYLKTNVARSTAMSFAEPFRRAGAIIRIESPGQVDTSLPRLDAGRPRAVVPSSQGPTPLASPPSVRPGVAPLPLDLGSDAGAEPFQVDSSSPAAAAAATARPPVPIAPPAAADLLPSLDLKPAGAARAAVAGARDLQGARELDLVPPPDLGPRREVEELGLDLGPPGGTPDLEIDLPPPRPVSGAAAPFGIDGAARGGRSAESPASPRRPGDPAAPKPIVVRPVPEPEPEPWLKRRYPHLIAITLLLVVGSYLYGCTQVMGSSTKFRREIGDVNRVLENMNARYEVVTDADVVAAVQDVGKRCDIDIGRDQIQILAEELGQIETGMGNCRFAKTPDSFQRLPPVDQQMILKSVQTCSAPDWILTIRVESKARWGLFSHTIDATATTWVRSYEP